jgi:hypothetical protein
LTLKRQPELGSAVITTLERAWDSIHDRHPELAPAVLITGPGSVGARRGMKLGHFAADRWQTPRSPALAEIFIGGEGLARGARPVLATVLHEAAHTLAHQRQIKETSRQGRYHNQRFKALAEEVGLEVEHHPSLGWSLTRLPDVTAELYAATIAELARVLVTHRNRESRATTSRGSNLRACACACGRRIRVAEGTYRQAAIVCDACHQPFRRAGGNG